MYFSMSFSSLPFSLPAARGRSKKPIAPQHTGHLRPRYWPIPPPQPPRKHWERNQNTQTHRRSRHNFTEAQVLRGGAEDHFLEAVEDQVWVRQGASVLTRLSVVGCERSRGTCFEGAHVFGKGGRGPVEDGATKPTEEHVLGEASGSASSRAFSLLLTSPNKC